MNMRRINRTERDNYIKCLVLNNKKIFGTYKNRDLYKELESVISIFLKSSNYYFISKKQLEALKLLQAQKKEYMSLFFNSFHTIAVIHKFVSENLNVFHDLLLSKKTYRYITEARQTVFRIYYELYGKEYDSMDACCNDLASYFDLNRVTIRTGIKTSKNVKKLNESCITLQQIFVNKYNSEIPILEK